jgi:hypothetical protein
MGGVPPMQNPFAPMPPMPLAGSPQPPMPMPPMAQGQGQQMMASTAGRRRRFGDALEGMLGRNQGIGAAMPQQQRPMPMPPMMPQQQMVAPGTPMMRTPTPRPMAMGGEVDIFDGGLSLGPAPDGLGVYLDGNRLSDPADMHQKMLRAGYSRDAIMDSAAHIADDLMEYAGGARSGFGHGGYEDGGQVLPRRTDIMGQDHFLAYIRPDEAEILEDLGGAGEPGPGGIPSYFLHTSEARSRWGGGSVNTSAKDADMGVGAINTGKTYTSSSVDWDKVFAANDDKPSNVTSAPVGEVDFTTINPATGQQTTVATIDYGDDDDDGPVIKDVTYYDDTGTTEVAAPVVTTNTAYVDPNTGGVTVYDEPSTPAAVYTPPPVYTDRRGKTYGSQAEADAADRAFAAQLALASASVRDDAARVGLGVSDDEVDYLAGLRMDDGKVQPGFVPSSMLGGAGPAGLYSGIGGIGSGPASGVGVGVTPAPITSPDISTDVSRPDVGPEAQYEIDDLFGTGLGSDILSLATPSAATMYPYDVPASVLADQLRGGPLTPGMALPDAGDIKPYDFAASTISADQPLTDDDMGLPSGPVTDLQSGLGRIAARDADMDPFGTGTQLSLQDVKDRVARAEGTADEGGYGRLLGNQEGRFGVDLTNMTVQEVLDFQKQRGPGSYAEYSQGVNKQRGQVRDDGTGKISTPAGKYQIVGATLEDLVKNPEVGVSLDDKFDAATQEKLGSYLIAERRGLNDLQAGNITREQFEANLGKEFEGIKRGLDKGAGSTALTIGAASETGRQVEQDRRDDNVEKIQQQIGDQAEPTGGEKLFYDFVGQLGFGLGKPFADKLRGASREDRQAIIDQHLYALQNGATPKTDEEGNYVGFDISTMDTFADKVLGAEDITQFLPGGAEDADGDGVPDYVRFGQVYDAQSTAADKDPYGMSTEQGFITEDGREFFVDATGNVVEVTDGVVPFEVGGGDDVTDIFTATTTTTSDDDDTTTTTTDDTGHKDGVCNNPDYVYNPETDMCEPPKEEETDGDLGSPITTGISPRSFDEVLRSVVVPAPDIPSISTNIRPMQGGGMAGLNRAADNFLKALAG